MTRLCVAALCSVSLFASAAAPKHGVAIGSSKEDEPCLTKASGRAIGTICRPRAAEILATLVRHPAAFPIGDSQ